MLLKQTLLYLPAQVIGPVAQFVSIVLWTHWLAPSDLGHLVLVTAAQELAYAVALGWFSLFTMRYGARFADADWRGRYLASEARMLLLVVALSVPFSIALAAYIARGYPDGPLLAATLGYAVTRTVTLHLQDRLRATMQVLAYTVLQLTGPVLGLVFGLAAVAWVAPTPTMVLTGYAMGHAVGLAWVYARCQMGPLLGRLDREVMRQALVYGLPLIVGLPAIWLSLNGIRFIVDLVHGATAVGLVTVGWGLGQRVASFVALLVAAAAFPLAVKRTHDEGVAAGEAQLQKNGVLLVAVLLPATAGLIVLGEPVVRLLVAEPYRAVTLAVLPWAMLAGCLRSVRLHFTDHAFLLHEQPRMAMYVDIADAVVSTLLCFAGLLLGGLVGATIGAALGSLVGVLISLALVRWRYGFVVEPAGHLKIAAATLVMTAAVVLLTKAVTAPLAAVLLATSLGACVYALALAVLLPDARREVMKMVAAKCSARGKPAGA
jgi:O-antigen/teichoic acid export membrane protein